MNDEPDQLRNDVIRYSMYMEQVKINMINSRKYNNETIGKTLYELEYRFHMANAPEYTLDSPRLVLDPDYMRTKFDTRIALYYN